MTEVIREWRCDAHPQNLRVEAWFAMTNAQMCGWFDENGVCERRMTATDRVVPRAVSS